MTLLNLMYHKTDGTIINQSILINIDYTQLRIQVYISSKQNDIKLILVKDYCDPYLCNVDWLNPLFVSFVNKAENKNAG